MAISNATSAGVDQLLRDSHQKNAREKTLETRQDNLDAHKIPMDDISEHPDPVLQSKKMKGDTAAHKPARTQACSYRRWLRHSNSQVLGLHHCGFQGGELMNLINELSK